MISEKTKHLLKALEAGNYNAKPCRMRQSCIFGAIDVSNWTEHEMDLYYVRATGTVGYTPYPPVTFYGDEKPRTAQEIQEVVDAAHEYALTHLDTNSI